ncbi:MAG: hypothetical protein IJ143_02415 [Neisseriaceae bacterium]|nr:hypothetical protein [Neisseriaceae bacterium]
MGIPAHHNRQHNVSGSLKILRKTAWAIKLPTLHEPLTQDDLRVLR